MDLLLNDEFDYDYDLRDLEDFVLLTTTSVIDIQESERAQAERAIAEFVPLWTTFSKPAYLTMHCSDLS